MEQKNKLQKFDLAERTAKIKVLTTQTAENMVEIGNTLLEVRENLPYGEFQNWLETGINYSKSTAYNLMKIAKEFPDFQRVGNLGMRKLLALADMETEEREKVINNNDLEKMTVKEVEEAIEIRKQLESIEFLMDILSSKVTQTGIDYDNVPNMEWDIDIFTGEKLTPEEVKEHQKGVEELFVDDINKTNNYWYKRIETLRENSLNYKAFMQKFYEENIMAEIQGDVNGDLYSHCRNLHWNITLIEYFRNEGDEQ